MNQGDIAMENITLQINGIQPDFDQARNIAAVLAQNNDDDIMLISWNDRTRDMHSPSCLQCEIKDTPGWEVYGINHGGRLRISINDDDYVFIFS